MHELITPINQGSVKYSVETALTHRVDSLLFHLDKNHITGMVMVDYKKDVQAAEALLENYLG